MGFTVEDMLIIARDKYDMELIAGKNGWANSISWLLMVEDTTITANFKGKELVVTQGVYFNTEERLLELVEILDKHHCAGLIVNSGYYIKEIPQKVIDYCDEVDLPLMDVPWDVVMSEMIKDLTVRIFLQSETDQQISDAFIKSFESPAAQDKYREKLSASFDVDGRFQVVLISTGDLDSMDSMDRRRIGYRLQIYMENISHNGHFFYYNGYFVLILNQVTKEQTREIIMGFMTRAARRMPDKEIYCGVGSPVMDVSDLHLSYRRAEYALATAMRKGEKLVRFDKLGMERLLYAISDQKLLLEMSEKPLKPILDYDREHNSDLLATLRSYLHNDGSIKAVADEMYIHKNTIVYRMNKIKELIGNDLSDGQERLAYYLACMIVENNFLQK
jgi:sugar diacid utilization regulator